MRKILPLALCATLLLTFPACAAQPEEPENPYRSISVFQEYMDESGEVTSTMLYETAYNDAGFIEKNRSYTDDVLTDEVTYEYDEYGNVLRGIRSLPEKSITENTLTLDDQHRPLRIESYENSEIKEVREYSYDKYGNETFHSYTYYENGEVIHTSSTETTYNRKSEIIDSSGQNGDSYNHSEYENGLLRRYTVTSKNGTVKYYVEYTYDSQGRISKTVTLSPDGTETSSCEYSYDETGLVETKLHQMMDNPHSPTKHVTTLDEYGNMLLQERFMQNESGEWYIYWRITSTYEPIPTA